MAADPLGPPGPDDPKYQAIASGPWRLLREGNFAAGSPGPVSQARRVVADRKAAAEAAGEFRSSKIAGGKFPLKLTEVVRSVPRRARRRSWRKARRVDEPANLDELDELSGRPHLSAMAQPREHTRPATAKRSRADKAEVARNATAGQFVLVEAGKVVAEVPVTPARFRRIVTKKRILGKMISGYADAAAKAKRTGKDYIIAYRVSPDGKAVEVAEVPAEKPAGSALDAAIARAKARGATKVTDILKGADMLTARAFGPLIGASHETVNAKRKRHELLGLEGATRGVKYPRWQVTEAGMPLRGLPRLFDALGGQPWTVYRFLRTRHAELGGRTALEALKAGEVDAVVGVAENQAAGAFS